MDKHRKACTESAWPTWPWPIGKRKRSLNKNMKSSHLVPVTQDSGPSSAISSQLASQHRHLVFLLHFDKRTSESFVSKMFLVWKEAKWFIWPASGIPVIRNLEACNQNAVNLDHLHESHAPIQDEILYCYHCVLSRRCSQCSLHLICLYSITIFTVSENVWTCWNTITQINM